jgi:hypothetical protein
MNSPATDNNVYSMAFQKNDALRDISWVNYLVNFGCQKDI